MLSLAEIGWLCRNVEAFVTQVQKDGRDAALADGKETGVGPGQEPEKGAAGLVQQVRVLTVALSASVLVSDSLSSLLRLRVCATSFKANSRRTITSFRSWRLR